MKALSKQEGDAALLPSVLLPLLNESFVQSCGLIERYTVALAAQVLATSALRRALMQPRTIDEVLLAAGLNQDVARVPVRWLLEILAEAGRVQRFEEGDAVRYRSVAGEIEDPCALLREQEVLDARCLPSYRIAALAAEHYAAVLRGELAGEQALFGPDTLDAWSDYFSNDNPLYAIANSIGAILIEQHLDNNATSILEIGGGQGSGAQAVWRRLQASQRISDVNAYRFTEISGIFLRRAQKALRPTFPDAPFSFAKLDIDQPFSHAGIAPASCTMIYGVNVLHVAHDLAATLAEIRTALTPNGTLVISECVRPFEKRPVYVEFVFNLLESFRSPVLVPDWRPNGGFLTPEQWRAALEANGFKDICFLPDIAKVRDVIPAFVVAGISAKLA